MKFIKADKPVSTNHKTLGAISVEVEVPQVESIEEFTQFAGGTDSALAFINNAIETNAKNGGRAALRTAPDTAVLDDLTVKVQGIVRDYAPQSGDRAPSKAKKAQAFDTIASLVSSGKEFSREELLALLEQAK